MENEELAALRATLLAAQRQPLAVKVRQARLSALLADGDELLPYVLSRSCSDPRDRTLERDTARAIPDDQLTAQRSKAFDTWLSGHRSQDVKLSFSQSEKDWVLGRIGLRP